MKTFLKTILAAAFLISAGVSVAQDSQFEPGKQRHQEKGKMQGMQGMPVVQKFMRAIHELDLSDEQKESIRPIMQNLKAEAGPLSADMKAGHMQMKALIKADKYDEDAVATLAAKEGALASERIVLTARALSDVYSQLNDEQRSQLDEMAAQRQERRGERRKHRDNRG